MAVVHDEDPLDVELDAAGLGVHEEVEGRFGGDEQQALEADGPLGVQGDAAQRFLPVMGQVAVELAIFLLRDLGFRTAPDGLLGIDGLVLKGLPAVLPFRDVQDDGPGDEVRVFLYDVADRPFVGVVLSILAGRAKVKGDRRPAFSPLGVGQGIGPLPVRIEAEGIVGPQLARDEGNPFRDHEHRVKAHAKLADQPLAGIVGPPGLQKLPGSGLGDGPQVLHDLLARHAYAVVGDGQGMGLSVADDANFGGEVRQLGVEEGLDTPLVQGIRRVRDQLAQKNVPVRVHRVYHHPQKLGGLRLKMKFFLSHQAKSPFLSLSEAHGER